MVLQVSSTSNFTLKIDPAVVLATRVYVDEETAKRLGKDETAAAARSWRLRVNFRYPAPRRRHPSPLMASPTLIWCGNLDMDKAGKARSRCLAVVRAWPPLPKGIYW